MKQTIKAISSETKVLTGTVKFVKKKRHLTRDLRAF